MAQAHLLTFFQRNLPFFILSEEKKAYFKLPPYPNVVPMNKPIYIFLGFVFFYFPLFTAAQKVDNTQLKKQIETYKSDPRGPYRDIRWFCKDGTDLPPQERCPNGEGVQRARYKDAVISLGENQHIFLGQILSTTDREAFWDAGNYHSRLKQYQLERYLRSIDDGWVLRKGQFYRGAFQVEDEEAWGIDFFHWVLSQDAAVKSQFFLLRQAIRDIPHRGGDDKALEIRALSKNIADAYPAFMDLRVKIHGQPEAADVSKVKDFLASHQSRMGTDPLSKLNALIAAMEVAYRPVDLNSLKGYLKDLPADHALTRSMQDYIKGYSSQPGSRGRIMATAERLAEIRLEVLNIKGRKARLALFDLSNALEEIFFTEVNQWQPRSLKESTEKICYTGTAAMGTGFVERWEWAELSEDLAIPQGESLSLAELNYFLERARSLLEWGTGMVNGVYKEVVSLYGGFEPLAYGFYDDRIRSSVLLSLGNSLGELGDFVASESQLTHQILDLSNASTLRGLNPGFARGELVIVDKDEEEVEVASNKIYVFNHPPSDLKPVAGILTVSEGNMVSHVQLLARNLGIPNAVLSLQNMESLKKYAGQTVFYAVANGGRVLMKTEAEMTETEKSLFAEKKRSETRITVPIEKMDLGQDHILNMREVDASFSGKVCGPKAANLGQLKKMFPDQVVEGIVLPFGIFRRHMDQPMPGEEGSYWSFLTQSFEQAEAMQAGGSTEAEVEAYTLGRLETLREAIRKMELLPAFVAELEEGFANIFGEKLGKVPVFLRSDTNMEDLKDFTGAGLNLTLFNVLDRNKIIQGIKDVWASPYTERSFKWRQRYLLNPENVFPSILIIPSVDVEYSGVMITKGIPTADRRDVTIAFSRGAGGAVDGQAAESYLLHHDESNRLLSPAREPSYRRLPEQGGTEKRYASFEKPILNPKNLHDLRWLAYNIHQEIPKATGEENQGPYDVELGFESDKVWLFQIRPFVENKNALGSAYLESISPKTDGSRSISLETPLQ
jgi:hypothetical protein